jgi:hypothetical protein
MRKSRSSKSRVLRTQVVEQAMAEIMAEFSDISQFVQNKRMIHRPAKSAGFYFKQITSEYQCYIIKS